MARDDRRTSPSVRRAGRTPRPSPRSMRPRKCGRQNCIWVAGKFDAWLLVVLAVAFDPAGTQRLQDHRRAFVEALAALLHRLAEGGEFPACQAAADAEAEPPLA